ncbi:LysR family transcriptional regulator [Limosilactobacillus gastricus]|nr:LysR family transcriptional regulator [Limosilactobacillus gastricus]QGF40273.1 LysR family transcriptional regulator [Limosilactobacillus gastricus]
MNLRHLTFFIELARTQHMGKAAANLNISQPSLSYAIRKLENELGSPLFEPNGRNIKLTKIGELILPYIKSSVTNLEYTKSLVNQLMDPSSGQVSFEFTYTLGEELVPSLLKAFFSIKQNQNIHVDMIQDNTYQVLRDLEDEKTDLVICTFADQLDGRPTNNIFQFTPLLNQEIVLAVPAKHPLAKKRHVHVSDLNDQPFIAYSYLSGLRVLMNEILEQHHTTPDFQYELEEDQSVIGFVKHGLGIALTPNTTLVDQDVVLKHLEDNQVIHKLYLVTKREHLLTPYAVRLRNYITNYCHQRYVDKGLLL